MSACCMHSLTEEHCRTDGVQIVISEYTHKLVHEFFDTRELDSVAVKGKAKGIRIFELLREKENSSSDEESDDPDNEDTTAKVTETKGGLLVHRKRGSGST